MSERCMPDTWFRAQSQATTMSFLTLSSQTRIAPLGEGERNLGWFVLPPFQRPSVWSREQQIKFIESCWMGLPVGVFVYNRTNADGPYDSWLLDGQQRITAVFAYLADEFPVLGYRYSELSDVDYRKWSMGTSFPCMVTQIENEEELREVYYRLAYGGTAHEPKT